MDREAWRAVIYGVTKSQTWLSHWTELNWIQVYALTSNTEEAEVERFYEDLQDRLELTPKKVVLSL